MNQNQIELENFNLPFSGKLRSENRWIKLAHLIPWGDFEINYSKSLKGSGFGPPAKSVRVALGALIIKERLGASDEEAVEQIRENPYLQYFLGFKEYTDEAPFHPTMFVHFRKRISKEMVCDINEVMNKKAPYIPKKSAQRLFISCKKQKTFNRQKTKNDSKTNRLC